MSTVSEATAGLGESFRAAIVAERQAEECCRDIAEHFEARNLPSLAALCRGLATRHAESVAILRAGGLDPSIADHWLDAEARDFILRIANPAQLLELAAATESDGVRLYAGVAWDATEHSSRAAAARLTGRPPRTIAECPTASATSIRTLAGSPRGSCWRVSRT